MEEILADYRAAQRWLYSLMTDPQGERFSRVKSAETIRAELQAAIPRLSDFLNFADNPHQKFNSIHVAGTSGKGSVTTMISALLTACGFKTADHTSPFLQIPNEKLRLDGKMISASQFAQLVWEFRRLYEAWDKRLAYIEGWNAITMMWVAQQQPDWGVIETGMGGRFDPSNVLPSELAVITNVDFDHTKSLGDTLPEIAWHKAGIIKPNKRVVTAATKPEVIAVIEREAREKNAQLQHVDYSVHEDGTLTVRGRFGAYERLALPLAGRYQLLNAATAITVVDWVLGDRTLTPSPIPRAKDIALGRGEQDKLSPSFLPPQESILQSAIDRAFGALESIGRFEHLQSDPTVIIDGAHNPHKVAALVRSMQAAYPERRVTVQMGMIANKDATAVIETLLPIANDFIFSEPNVYGKLAQPSEKLGDTLRKLVRDVPYLTIPDVIEGIEWWLQWAEDDDILLVTGSIYLIGEARGMWFSAENLLHDLERSQF